MFYLTFLQSLQLVIQQLKALTTLFKIELVQIEAGKIETNMLHLFSKRKQVQDSTGSVQKLAWKTSRIDR